jgi:hypothetical protein
MSELTDELDRQRQSARAQSGARNAYDMPWYEVGKKAVSNFPESAMGVAEDAIYPFLNPVTTAKSVLSLGKGIYQLTTPGEQPDEATARAVGNYFVDRYGSMVGFKNAIAEDPAGVLMDASTVISGGAGLAAKLPGQLGQMASKAGNVADMIDPLNLSAKAVTGAVTNAPAAVRETLGLTTGVGGQPITEAFEAGREGGARQDALLANMRDEVDVTEVAEDAISAMGEQRRKFTEEYSTGKKELDLENVKVDMEPISQSVNDLRQGFEYEGQSELSKQGQKKLKDVEKLVATWSKSKGLHTAKGLDILKRRIDNEYPTGLNPGDSAMVITRARKIIKDAILEQSPDYAKVMKPYEEAVNLEREMQRALSLGKNSSADTILRKLQSVMRNNVNANFGSRLKLVEQLENAGDYLLLPKIAGQSLNTLAPRGLSRLGPLTGGAAAFATGNAAALTNPAVLAALSATSPRLVGEASNLVGRGAGLIDQAANPMISRMQTLMDNPMVSGVSDALTDNIGRSDLLDIARRSRVAGGAASDEDQLNEEQLELLRALRQ